MLNKITGIYCLFAVILLLALNSCISLPISSEIRESKISGYIDGEKSNLDEKIIQVAKTPVWEFIGVGAHTPGPKADYDSTHYSYYLEKNGRRIELDFLNKENAAIVCNVNNQWFSFEIRPEKDYFKVIQFDFNKSHEKHKIHISLPDAISEMYINKKTTSLVWREVNMDYHEYDLSTGKMKRSYFLPSKSELSDLLKINIPTSKYEELDFYEAVDSDKSPEKQYNPLEIVKTDSIDLLRNASLSRSYLLRWAVVFNPNATKKIVEKLSDDDSYYVASAAKKRTALSLK